MKKNIVMLLILGIIVAVSSMSVSAADTISGNTVENPYFNSYRDETSYWEMYGNDTEKEVLDSAGASSLPSSYDSRAYGYITAKKSQFYGTCWAFATIAAAEASIVKSGLADNSLDLSEYHLAYYNYKENTDPLGNTEGDLSFVSSNVRDILLNGGNLDDAAWQLAKWCGPVSESVMTSQDAENLVEPTTDLSFQSAYHLKNAVWSGCSFEDYMDVKKLIMKYGAVATSYYNGPSQYYNYDNQNEITYHIPNATIANHAICLVGWDDNYPKEKFNSQPEGDGAWLVKNTDGINQPYMWMSYYTNLSDGAYAYEFEPAGIIKYNYQYDGCTDFSDSCRGVLSSSKPIINSCMNIFKAKRSTSSLEKLEAIMVNCFSNTTINVQIYVNPVMKNGQLTGYDYKTDSFSYTAEYGGIYQIEVPETIYLNEGDTFGVEVSGERIDDYPISSSYTTGGIETVHPGESYVGQTVDGEFSYVDLSTFNYSGNLRIKALTNETSIPLATGITINTNKKDLTVGESFVLTGSVTVPAGGLNGISYRSSDPEIATVDASGTVTALSPGTVTITAITSYGNEKAECEVTVKGKMATSLSTEASVNLTMYNRHQLKTELDSAATNRVLSYSSSDSSIVLVDEKGELYGVYPGTAYVTVKTTDGSNLSATCKVTVKSFYTEDKPDVSIQSITEMLVVTATQYQIPVGGLSKLQVERYPEQVTDPRLEYSVSDTQIISLQDGVIQGLKPGTASITVKALDSGITGTINIIVTGENQLVKEETIKIGTTFIYKNLQYIVTSSDTVKLTGAKNNNIKILVIPATVKYSKKTFKVTEVGNKAFHNCTKLKTIKIGTSVSKIGNSAFANCPVQKINIPLSVKEIGKKAFYNCKKLKTITIKSKNIKSVGKNAFKGIASAAKLTVPKNKYNTYKKTTFKNAGFDSKVIWKKK